jgi:hypothetical protein
MEYFPFGASSTVSQSHCSYAENKVQTISRKIEFGTKDVVDATLLDTRDSGRGICRMVPISIKIN